MKKRRYKIDRNLITSSASHPFVNVLNRKIRWRKRASSWTSDEVTAGMSRETQRTTPTWHSGHARPVSSPNLFSRLSQWKSTGEVLGLREYGISVPVRRDVYCVMRRDYA